jgi:drug/metabolite transporter (DMT)-like permease
VNVSKNNFHLHPGIAAALGAALLFGAGAPLAKLLLRDLHPLTVAGLLYLGSGLGLTLYRALRQAPAVQLQRGEWKWLAGAILCGGLVGPGLLMWGLANMTAVSASLLLNAEGVFTVLLAWGLFHEHVGRRLALGMGLIAAGALVLSWPGSVELGSLVASLAVLGACLAWGLDNNLTRRVSLHDASWIAAVKGLCAGSLNLLLGLALGSSGATTLPALGGLAQWPLVLLLGFLSYGVSLSLFVVALRGLGTARTGAYFSVAPFFGALLALALGEPLTPALGLAGALMALGVWLHLSESHAHEHCHALQAHEHRHSHDAHHRHEHAAGWDGLEPHSHLHRHQELRHTHAHYPDPHHGHEH